MRPQHLPPRNSSAAGHPQRQFPLGASCARPPAGTSGWSNHGRRRPATRAGRGPTGPVGSRAGPTWTVRPVRRADAMRRGTIRQAPVTPTPERHVRVTADTVRTPGPYSPGRARLRADRAVPVGGRAGRVRCRTPWDAATPTTGGLWPPGGRGAVQVGFCCSPGRRRAGADRPAAPRGRSFFSLPSVSRRSCRGRRRGWVPPGPLHGRLDGCVNPKGPAGSPPSAPT